MPRLAVTDGQVRFVNDTPEPATITPCPGIKLLINGTEISVPTPVKPADQIEVVPEVVKKDPTVSVRISKDGMQAYVEIQSGSITTYQLVDHFPTTDLKLEAAPHTVPYTAALDYAVLAAALSEAGVCHGIKQEVLQRIAASPGEGSFLVAEGTPPTSPVDEQVEIKFSLESTEGKPVIRPDGSVDFYEQQRFVSVDKDSVLAVKHKAIPGKPGKKVTGEEIPPRKPVTVTLQALQGARLSHDGNQVLAEVSGRPSYRKVKNNYLFEVLPVLQYDGDVNLQTGNIRFKGDVIIKGNVTEGMLVQATGKVEIKGTVTKATVKAGAHVVLHNNTVGSKIIAGGDQVYYERLVAPFNDLKNDLKASAKLIQQLVDTAQARNQSLTAGQAMMILIDKKYSRLPSLVKNIHQVVDQINQEHVTIPAPVQSVLETISGTFSSITECLKIQNLSKITEILQKVDAAQECINQLAKWKANITVPYTANSILEATGDVIVTGGGCYNTVMHVKGNVEISGIFRGGEIKAGGDIKIKEAGTELGIKTKLQTAFGRNISLQRAHKGLIIQIGNRSTQLDKSMRNVNAVYDREYDKIEVVGLKA
ncbi:MAG: DUF342 domain-containing protein [Peptococcaceae bacterium]|nr:DUF342 domain-containing protein [Peptococcaceae bacterium]